VSDLVSRRVTVMAVVDSTAAVPVAKAATQSIPIVFRIGGDPVVAGIVPNLNRPGGTISRASPLLASI
jgi:putative tryptophan/tyrosine transport system substrate-binding protein